MSGAALSVSVGLTTLATLLPGVVEYAAEDHWGRGALLTGSQHALDVQGWLSGLGVQWTPIAAAELEGLRAAGTCSLAFWGEAGPVASLAGALRAQGAAVMSGREVLVAEVPFADAADVSRRGHALLLAGLTVRDALERLEDEGQAVSVVQELYRRPLLRHARLGGR